METLHRLADSGFMHYLNELSIRLQRLFLLRIAPDPREEDSAAEVLQASVQSVPRSQSPSKLGVVRRASVVFGARILRRRFEKASL